MAFGLWRWRVVRLTDRSEDLQLDGPWMSGRPSVGVVADRLAGVDNFEGVAGDRLEVTEVVVAPARVGGARDVPVGAVVGDDHAVLLERGADDLDFGRGP